MESSAKNKIYFSVVAGLGLLAGLPSAANAAPAVDAGVNPATSLGTPTGAGLGGTAVNRNGSTIEIESSADTIINVDNNNGSAGEFGVNDFNNATGSRVRVLTVDADNGVQGSHTDGTNTNTWFFDETGSEETTIEVGTTKQTKTKQTATNKKTEVIDSATKYTSANQTSDSLYDELINGANSNTNNRTAFGRTDTVTDGPANTTTVTQSHTDAVTATDGGAGASRAEIAVRRSGGAGNTQATVLVRNAAGNTHGLTVGESSTTLSGGTNSTTLILDDNGAKFNGAGGAPARVTGVADGTADFDAVNFRQLNSLDKKLSNKINETGAIAAAFAQLGQAQTPGKSTFGIAAGGQGGKSGLAIGFSHRPVTMKPVVIKASLGASGSTTSGGVGATWEF